MNKLTLALPILLVSAACDRSPVEPATLSPASTRSASLAGNSTVVVAEASVVRQLEDTPPTNNWVLYTRAGTPPTAGQFVIGPDAPPLGVGSFQSQLPLSTQKLTLFNYDHVGTALSSITGLSYATYKNTGGSFPFPSINIQIDINGGTLNPGEFRTLVFEPYVQPGFIDAVGMWESRDAYVGGAAKWWSTGSTPCPQSNPCTWNTIVATYPAATITGGFGINAGSGNMGLDGSVDALSIAYGGGSVTYDFEPFVTATSRESCKDGGWKTRTRADGSPFKNQGDCVSYVNNGH
ncbi:MAG: hypothetical protein JWL61_4876 [Gemmatimonadetes bacterium]|nr:hypothetical protein [Gemmatimonadota bacterium]